MRPIDADALRSSIRESYEMLNEVYGALEFDDEKRICGAQLITFQECMLRINDAPTIDAEPVRHGRWEMVGTSGWNRDGYYATPKFRCTACKKVPKAHMTQDYTHGGTINTYRWEKTDFCPHCGAKMDGGKKNDCTRNPSYP